jgi:Mg2+ and Co2+ transporter CorA
VAGVLLAEKDDPLVWAVRFPPQGAPLQSSEIDTDAPGWVWAHFDLVHAGVRPAIEALPGLPPQGRDLLLGKDNSQRLILDDGLVAGVLPAFSRSDENDVGEVVMWHFVLLPEMLITARRTPLRTLLAAWEGTRKGYAPVSPAALVHRLIGEFALQARHEVEQLADRLEDVEDGLLTAGKSDDMSQQTRLLSATRRSANQLRRAVAPLLRLLRDEETDWPDWAADSETRETVERHVLVALEELHSVQERANILRDEIASRQTEETNRRLYLMSIVTTLVMPAALVTGYFGMNTGALPWSGDFPRGSLYASGVMVGSVALTLLLLRLRRLL